MVNLLAAAGLTTTLPEVAVVKPVAVKLMVMVLATVWKRLLKVTMPLTAVAVVVPCKVPAPAFRVAVTTVELSELLRLPNWSSTRITGCGAKTTPAAAVADGCVWIVNLVAAPGTSASVPRFDVLLVTTAMTEVPVLVRLTVARGVPAVGRTRTFCQVSEQVTAFALAAVIVKVIWVEDMPVTLTAVPL